jgi:hypothetical protein
VAVGVEIGVGDGTGTWGFVLIVLGGAGGWTPVPVFVAC